ncbi:MAG: STAS domain-containing protein [Actinomycetota bacterium]
MTTESNDYRIRRAGPQAVITLPEEIDVTNADPIRQALLSAVNPDITALIIDMSGTTFCDSAGLYAIVAAYRQATAAGTQLRLVATSILRIFQVIGVDQLIPTYPSLEAALATHE